MARSKKDLVNSALAMISGIQINSFEDEDKPSRTAKDLIDSSIDTIIRKHNWNCLKKRIQLFSNIDSNELSILYPDHPYSFELPNDYSRMVKLIGTFDQDYKIERRNIYYSETPIVIQYISDSVDISEWDSLLVGSIEYYLAYLFVMPLLQDRLLSREKKVEYEDFLSSAKTIDSQEDGYREEEDDWIEARFGSRRNYYPRLDFKIPNG